MMQLDFERLRSMGLTPALANQAMACAARSFCSRSPHAFPAMSLMNEVDNAVRKHFDRVATEAHRGVGVPERVAGVHRRLLKLIPGCTQRRPLLWRRIDDYCPEGVGWRQLDRGCATLQLQAHLGLCP